jgi:hypothetical protein
VYFGFFLPRPVGFFGGGWNEKSRLALTRAIVENGTIAIDIFEKGTGDKAYYNGHYYSDKAPGLSLFAVPVYAVIYGTERMFGSRRVDAIDPPDVVNWWLITLLAVSVPCAFGAVLFDRLCLGWTHSVEASSFATLALILATPYSFYASVFVGHGLAAAMAIAVVYLVFRTHRATARDLLFAGLLSGAAIAVEYPFALIAAVIAGYVVLKRRDLKGAAAFVAGTLPGLMMLAFYLTAAFGSPFRTGYLLEARPEFAEIHRAPLLGFSLPSALAFLGITVSPFRGIFFFCPILILGLFGLWTGWRKRLPEIPFGWLWAVVAGYPIVNAAYAVWDGGDLPLARHSLLAVPFLTLGIALWGTGFHSAPARWLFLLSAFSVFTLRLNVYHSVAWLNPLFDLALPNLLSAYTLPTAGSFLKLPGITSVIPHIAATVGILIFARRRLM